MDANPEIPSALTVDQERIAAQTREIEGRFREMIDTLPVAIYTTDADGHLTLFNPAAVKFSGRVPQLGTDQWCVTWKLFRSDGTPLPHNECPMAVALREGRVVDGMETLAERPDGTRVWFIPYPRPLRDVAGKIVGGVNMLLDITERKQAEQSTVLMAAIVDSSDDAIVSKNLDGTITTWNRGAERLFGYSAEEAIGQHISLIVPSDRLDEEAMILERLRRGERVDHFETVRVRKDGTTLDISLTISPLRDGAGRVVGASKVARDITQRKQAQKALTESELSARLLQLQDEERRRIARELHDGVGQLLTAMSMNVSRVVREKSNLSPDAARCVEENSNLIEQVARDIRTVSYLLHPPMLDEMGLRSALKWYVEGFAERSKIATNLELPADWERLPRDQELCLFRVAQECLTNIHRHSGSSTALVRLWRGSREIKMVVQDGGRGVDQEMQAKLASGGGTGVGLLGMRERLRQLGGTLEIDANGDGTTVTATLPNTESTP